MGSRFAWLVLLATPVAADQVWFEVAGAESTANGHRLSVIRTLDGLGVASATAGIQHFRFGDARWTLAEASASRRLGEKLILDGTVQFGPGRIGDSRFAYRKAMFGATVLLNGRWSANLNDTYINIDDTIGHIASGAVTRSFATGSSVTFNLVQSVSSSIDTRQFGVKFSLQREFRVIGGAYAGRTRNPVILNEFGADFGGASVDIRQAFIGLGKPLGRLNLLAVFDYLNLGDINRREIALVLQMPIGNDTGASR